MSTEPTTATEDQTAPEVQADTPLNEISDDISELEALLAEAVNPEGNGAGSGDVLSSSMPTKSTPGHDMFSSLSDSNLASMSGDDDESLPRFDEGDLAPYAKAPVQTAAPEPVELSRLGQVRSRLQRKAGDQLVRCLTLLDRPFQKFSYQVKKLIGLAAMSTLCISLITWFYTLVIA